MPHAGHSHFQALDPEARRLVISLAAMLRLADSLDRGHAQNVGDVTSSLREGTVWLSIEAESDVDLELWAAGEAAKIFAELYVRPIQVVRTKPGRSAV